MIFLIFSFFKESIKFCFASDSLLDNIILVSLYVIYSFFTGTNNFKFSEYIVGRISFFKVIFISSLGNFLYQQSILHIFIILYVFCSKSFSKYLFTSLLCFSIYSSVISISIFSFSNFFDTSSINDFIIHSYSYNS